MVRQIYTRYLFLIGWHQERVHGEDRVGKSPERYRKYKRYVMGQPCRIPVCLSCGELLTWENVFGEEHDRRMKGGRGVLCSEAWDDWKNLFKKLQSLGYNYGGSFFRRDNPSDGSSDGSSDGFV